MAGKENWVSPEAPLITLTAQEIQTLNRQNVTLTQRSNFIKFRCTDVLEIGLLVSGKRGSEPRAFTYQMYFNQTATFISI